MSRPTNFVRTVIDAIGHDWRSTSDVHSVAYALLCLYPGYSLHVQETIAELLADPVFNKHRNDCEWLRAVSAEFNGLVAALPQQSIA